MFITALFCQFANAQQWQLTNPTDGAPGFTPGYGENIHVGGENDPGLRLTRTATAVRPTVVISDTNYTAQREKDFPLIAQANNGEAIAFWINRDNRINPQWRARKINISGSPQGEEFILPEIPADQSRWIDTHWDIASNGEQIVFVWQYLGDIFYQLYNFNGIPLTTVKQANQDTTIMVPGHGNWNPSTNYPSVSILNDNTFVIAWQDARQAELIPTDYGGELTRDIGEIYARRFSGSGDPIGDNFLVNQDSFPWVQTLPTICLNDSGTIFCCWIERDTTATPYYPDIVRGRFVGKNFSRDFEASGYDHYYTKPVVASSSTGFAALWQQDNNLYVQAMNHMGEPLWSPVKVHNSRVANYTLKTLDNQQYAIFWNKDNSYIIQACLLNPGDGSLGDIQTFNNGESFITKMAAGNKGTTLVFLNDNSKLVNSVTLNNNLEPQQTIERLNTDCGGAEHKEPDCVQLTNGNYIAVWLDTRNSVLSIYGQIFDQNGDKIGSNFAIYTPAEHYGDQIVTIVAHPQDGAIVAYKSQAVYKGDNGAWLQRITSDGELEGPSTNIVITNEIVNDVKIAFLPDDLNTLLATWVQNKILYGKLFDSDLNSLSERHILNSPSKDYNLYADNKNRFWILGKDENNYNIYLSGFNNNLDQFWGPEQLNDSTIESTPSFSPQLAILPNGRMLTIWAYTEGYSTRIDDVIGQLVNDNGLKIGNNFRVSSWLIKNKKRYDINGYHCLANDSLFVISWNTSAYLAKEEIGLVWLNQNGKLEKPAINITNINFLNHHFLFPLFNNSLLFLHETKESPNPIDIAVDIFEPSFMNTSGWYNSPIFHNTDSLIWKKLTWIANSSENAKEKVFFRCKDYIINDQNEEIPWQQIVNGQTENLPAGKRAQWRVELTGTESVSPIVYDLIGEYERKTGIEKTTDAVPYSYRLDPVYPNPANSRVTIAYELAAPAKTTIAIYNILGQRINQWQLTQQPAGRHTWHWNGETGLGARAASGLYFITLEANSFRATRKVVLMQ